MGYVKGSLQPREVCTTELVWVPADSVEPGYEFEELGAPGVRVSFGDAEFIPHTFKQDGPGLTTVGAPETLPPDAATVPLPPAGGLFALAALAAVCYTFLWSRRNYD